MTILPVGDESRLAVALIELFHAEKYLMDRVDNGEDGLRAALQKDYGVIILDIMLPKMDGFAVMYVLRRTDKEMPIFMLTVRDEIRGKIEGLDCGTDDYTTKLFVPEELLACVRVLSRHRDEVLFSELRFGGFCLPPATSELTTDDKTTRLAFKEARLLELLVASEGATLGKGTIPWKLWGDESDAVENNVEAYVSFLQKKLAFLEFPVKIQALRRQGYHLVEGDVQ